MMKSQIKPVFSTRNKPNILLVDDDPADVDLALEILEDAEGSYVVNSVHNGIDALAFLRRQSPYENAPCPDLVLLDLNMPKMDGREVLQAVRNDRSLCHIPIMVLTTSDDNFDICRSYQLGANGYMTKPVGIPAYANMVNKLESFWFAHMKLPGECT